MNLAEFKSLCEKEWRECRGDIITLWLTEKNYQELSKAATGAHMQNRTELFIRAGYEDLGPAHPAFDNVINPVTGNPVRLRLAMDNSVDAFSANTKQMYSFRLPGEDCDIQPV